MSTALSDLRRLRRARRLGDTEWFDLAYHVYLAGIFGGSAVIIASDFVGDEPLGDAAVADVFAFGPGVLGLVAVIALVAGARGGAEGGPVSVEPADARHLLLAPVARRTVLRVPLLQRLRAVVFAGALLGGIAGLLAAQRLPGTAPAWTLSGGGFGACVGALAVAAATIVHAAGVRAWVPVVAGAPLVAWQTWSAVGGPPGPADTLGSLALWGYRQRPVDLAGVAAVMVLIAGAVALVGRLRVELLARRSALVSQLRFAVTMQDLRTVVLLRRQLRQEQPRTRPWLRLPPREGGPGGAAIRRGFHGFGRTPVGRIGRMGATAATTGVAAGVAARGTTAMVVACAIALFVLGLDLIEPLSQEVDHPDRTDALPLPSGWLHARLLVAPAFAAVPAALVAATACSLVAPRATAPAFVLAVPVVWAGMVGAVVNALRDDHPAGSGDAGLIVPPEMAGFKNLVRVVVPVALSSVGMLAVLAVRERPDAAMVARAAIGLGLYLATVRWWIVHRHPLRLRWEAFVAGARA